MPRAERRADRRSAVRAAALLLALLASVLAATARAQSNDCSDPYWADTLRCRAHPDPASLTPQPPPLRPLTAAQVKQFTRVDLAADPAVRCADGTVPVLYVDGARDGPSDDWVFTVPGGPSCYAHDDGSGALRDGQDCLDRYLGGDAGDMSTANAPATRNIGVSAAESSGIHSPDPTDNPVFARFNRVRVQKCSIDRYNGRSTRTVGATHPGRGTITFDLHQHGQLIFLAALDALRGGLRYDRYENDGAGGVRVTPDGARLPPLESARRVLLIGHSAGAYGMYFNADRLREHMEAWPDFGGDVRVVFDANFFPALENEAAFAMPVLGDLYDHVLTGDSAAAAPISGTYDASFFSAPTSPIRTRFRSYLQPGEGPEAVLDASCVASHPAMPWICADRFHVLFNHVTTPLLLREDLSDPNTVHTGDGLGHPLQWGERGDYPHCAVLGAGTPCDPLLTLEGRVDRLLEQAKRFLEDAALRSELATGVDASGAVPSRWLWMPDCRNHGGAFNDDGFFDTRLGSEASAPTYREFIESFLAAPARGSTASRIDGVAGASSSCPSHPTAVPTVPTLPPVAHGLLLLGLALTGGLTMRLSRGGAPGRETPPRRPARSGRVGLRARRSRSTTRQR